MQALKMLFKNLVRNALGWCVFTGGYPLNVYARVIPRTLTSLSLPLVFLSLRDMQVVARRAPGLQHLHTDLWSTDGHACLRELPQLFCQLRTLSLR